MLFIFMGISFQASSQTEGALPNQGLDKYRKYLELNLIERKSMKSVFQA